MSANAGPSGFHPDLAGCSVAIVDDEPVLLQELSFQLLGKGFEVVTFEAAPLFYRYLAVSSQVVAVLDIGLPGEDGLSMCAYLREHHPQMGIVLLTARGQREDRLAGLTAGADAYLTKPVDMDELVLVLRRLVLRQLVTHERASAPTSGLWRVPDSGDWQLDVQNGQLIDTQGRQIRLSLTEFHLLRALMLKRGLPCGFMELALSMGMHGDELDKHRLEVIISRLRSKVERTSGQPLPVRAVRGVGYCFAVRPGGAGAP